MNTQTFSPVTTKVQFIKEWTPEQFKAMERAIARHFNERTFIRYSTGSGEHTTRLYRSFNHIDSILGLAYTSTGIWACYGICNVAAWFDEDNIYQYSYFTIGNNGHFYAVLQDKEENELVIEL